MQSTNQGGSSTQDNVVKKPVIMGTATNAEGAESGETTLIGAVPGDAVSYILKSVNEIDSTRDPQINITASGENRSAKWKSGSQDIPEAGRNQYQ